MSPRPDVVTAAAIAAAKATGGQATPAEVDAALDQWAEQLAGRVVDKLGQGLLVPAWAWEVLQRAPGVWQSQRFGMVTDDMYTQVSIYGSRVELSLRMQGGQVIWSAQLRPA